MRPYTEEELCHAVYYPACGVDFSPILDLSHIWNLFIYVDWRSYWSESKDERLKRLRLRKLEIDMQIELAKQTRRAKPTQATKKRSVDDIFKPCSYEDYKERLETQIQETTASEQAYYGMKKHLPDSLELIGERRVLLAEMLFPPGFTLTPEESDRYQRAEREEELTRGFRWPWATEVKLRRKMGTYERELKLVYITEECFATYSALFRSGQIAPKVFVTTQTGMGPGFAQLQDPIGITDRFLRACEKRPLLWVRNRNNGNPENSLYNTPVEEYMGWPTMGWFAEAFRTQEQNFTQLD